MPSTPQTTDKRSSTPCLVGLVGAAEGRQLVLDGARVLLGRDASRCQLVLEHALVSREHAAFETDSDGRVVVKDLGSRQGTFVNGVAVTRQELCDGDAVGFGRGGMLAFRFQTAQSLAPGVRTQSPRHILGSGDQIEAQGRRRIGRTRDGWSGSCHGVSATSWCAD